LSLLSLLLTFDNLVRFVLFLSSRFFHFLLLFFLSFLPFSFSFFFFFFFFFFLFSFSFFSFFFFFFFFSYPDLSTEDVFVLLAARRRAVADLLEVLDEDQLAMSSLCAGWDVRTVGAHLAEAAAPGALSAFLQDLVRARGRVHRANDAAARRAAGRPVAETVALLRERAENRSTPPVTGPPAPLTDVLVHEGDIRIPLGLPYDPDECGRPPRDGVRHDRQAGRVRPRGRQRGLRLSATDLDWAWGDGPAVQGRGIDLLMAACGRPAVLSRLAGPGRHLLADRLDGAHVVRRRDGAPAAPDTPA
jgi:uncharacterized protein (TIGR03083 family)